MSTEQSPTTDLANPEASQRKPWLRRSVFAVVAVVVLALAAYWFYQRATHVYSDDARIAANMINISSKTAGWVVEFPVSQGDRLQPGALIAVMDSREMVLVIKQLQAKLAAMEAGLDRGKAEIVMVQQQTSGSYQAAQSQLSSAEAALSASESDREFNTSEWQRAQSLRKKKIISQQDWETTRNAWRHSEQALQQARAQVSSARAKLIEAEASQARLAVLENELLRLQFERDSLALQVEQKRVNLADHRIVANTRGLVDKTFINAGEHVMPGQRLLMMHEPGDIWIDANIKETAVRYLKPGQKGKVTVDAYSNKSFEGVLERIGNAATSQFSLLPSTSPSGNFTKVTQRIPVRISLVQQQDMLKPGMMVEVAIEHR